jgi:hypothetical protein
MNPRLFFLLFAPTGLTGDPGKESPDPARNSNPVQSVFIRYGDEITPRAIRKGMRQYDEDIPEARSWLNPNSVRRAPAMHHGIQGVRQGLSFREKIIQ